MSLLTAARRRISVVKCPSRRNITQRVVKDSKPARTEVKSHRTLPPAKMRALVSLYHQADDWITAENLLQRIDAALVPPTQHHHLALPSQEGISLVDLQNAVRTLKTQPRMAQAEADESFRRLGSRSLGVTAGLSLMLSKREKKMIEALYGVNISGRQVVPGWEVLEERALSNRRT